MRSSSCASRTQFVVGVDLSTFLPLLVILLTSMSYFDSAVLLDEAARTDITRTLTRDWFYRRALHTGGWRVSVSPTLVEPSVATPGPCEG